MKSILENLKGLELPFYVILGALYFVAWVNFSFEKVQKFMKSKFSVSKCVEMEVFALLNRIPKTDFT